MEGEAARAAGPRAEATVRMVERDVEAPEVFQADGPGLWDGRPSLGGVWVAHPDVGDPERVIIRNEANGQFVIGALFRRERDNPGPRIQVSSDAAAALGILAGAPTVLNVTALRRVEQPEATQRPAEPAPQPAAEPAHVAAAEPSPPRQAAQQAPQQAQATAAAAAQATARPPASTPRAEGAISMAELPRSAPAGAAVPSEPRVALAGPTRPGNPRMTPAAIASATGAQGTGPAATPQRHAAATPVSAPAATAPASARIDRAYVQIGIFSVQDNANRTAQRMRGAGLQANILEEQSRGQTYWRVTVGPAASTDERARILANVKGMGFTDAYAVSR